jgi:hypothetical protein
MALARRVNDLLITGEFAVGSSIENPKINILLLDTAFSLFWR